MKERRNTVGQVRSEFIQSSNPEQGPPIYKSSKDFSRVINEFTDFRAGTISVLKTSPI